MVVVTEPGMPTESPDAGHPFAALPASLDSLADPSGIAMLLWRGRRRALACVLGCLGFAGVYLLNAPRIYQATAKLLVLEQGGTPLSTAGADASRLIRGAEDDIPTHAMLVSSPIVVRRAVDAIGRKNLPSLASTGTDAAVLTVIENLAVTRPDRQAKILQIAYRSQSPEEAVRIVKAVADSYKSFLEEVFAKGNSDVVNLMSRARDDLHRELKELERRYLEFRQKTPQLSGDASGRSFINHRVDEWDRAAREAMVRGVHLKAQLELGRGLAKDGAGLWSIAHALDQVGGGGVNSLGARAQSLGPAPPSDYLRLLATEQQQLSSRLGPQSTKVKEIQEQISQAQTQAREARVHLEESEVRDLLSAIDKSLRSIETMRTEIQSRFDQDMNLARKAEIDLLAESNMKSELERQRKLFDSVVEQLQRATLVGDFSNTRSQVIEPPNVGPRAVRPLVALTLGLALVTGCMLGIGIVIGSELIDPRVRSAGEVLRVLRLPVLGQVPYVSGPHAPPPGSIGPICQVMPRSTSAEAYRVVRANLDLARRNRVARLVLVTGPGDDEGKTTVAANLAVALAQTDRLVLLVDANLRSPTLHRTFALPREPGLVHLLRDSLPMGRVIQATQEKNLDIITSGPEVADPAELLSSQVLGKVLAGLREGYDTVIIDSPSLLGVADPSLLGAQVDGIVLVLRISTTRRVDAVQAVESLRGLGTPVLGVVLNGARPQATTWHRSASPEENGQATDLDLGTFSGEIPYDPQMSSAPGLSLSNGWEPDLDPFRESNPTTEGPRC
ncbi:MAG: hypothetical protein NVSMB9_03380 [Isosphaeraceae bacterium]